MISFASCDWGTSTFRLRLPPGVRPREIRNQSGVASLANRGGDRAQGFRDTLNQARSALSIPTEIPILISGMASSSLGWKELPYAELPFALDGSDAIWTDLGEHLYLISGARDAWRRNPSVRRRRASRKDLATGSHLDSSRDPFKTFNFKERSNNRNTNLHDRGAF